MFNQDVVFVFFFLRLGFSGVGSSTGISETDVFSSGFTGAISFGFDFSS